MLHKEMVCPIVPVTRVVLPVTVMDDLTDTNKT